MRRVVIVGAGQAGYQVAASLRAKKFAGSILILGDEPVLPYQRPPLSKGYVKGEMKEDALLLRPESFYATNDIAVRLGCPVAALDRATREVVLADGERVAYDSLVLATGGRVRPLPVPGADLAGVAYVRTLADAVALKPQIEAATNVVVIGGGFIGLECAAVARTLGCDVTVLEAMDRLMARVVSPVLSDYYRDLHRSRGVDVRLGASVTEIIGSDGRVTGVRCGDGATVPADLVVVGIGIIANDDLAKAAGLACDRGIVVDALLRTADPDIYAIGDCATFPHPMAADLLRLESVQNAIDQGKTVADAIMGDAKPLRGGAVVLVRPIRGQAADRRHDAALRRHRHARRRRRRPVLGAVLPQGHVDRHRFREHAERPCGGPQAVRRRQDRGHRCRARARTSACGRRCNSHY